MNRDLLWLTVAYVAFVAACGAIGALMGVVIRAWASTW